MASGRIDRLILVYNADAGRAAALADSLRKALALPACTLCSITHGLFGEKPEWTAYKARVAGAVDYLHRDEVPADLRAVIGGELPCVVGQAGGGYVLLLDPVAVGRCAGRVGALASAIAREASARGLELPGSR